MWAYLWKEKLDFLVSCINSCDPYRSREVFWNKVEDSGFLNYPYLVMASDLNFTLSEVEIWGSSGRSEPLGLYLCQLLLRHGLMDVPLAKIMPTWWNGCVEDARVCKRLDRVIITELLVDNVDRFRSWVIQSSISDHMSISFQVE